jgi:drug/metabolite transporter (DMT)-like permease
MSDESMTSKWNGIVFALGAAILFGASTPLSKMLLGSVDPWLLAGVLYLGAGAGLLLFQWIRVAVGLPAAEAPLKRSDLPWLVAVVLFGGVAGPVLLMLGLALTDASSASLLLNLEGIATMTIAWVVFRENVDRRLIVGALSILAGAALLSWDRAGVQLGWGGLLIAAACLCWGIDNNLTRKLSSADPVQIAAIKGLVAGTVNTGLAFALGASLPTGSFIVAGALVGFLGIGVSLVFFMLGLRHLGTARTGAYFSFAPFIGAVLSVVFLGDAVSVQLIVAAILMAIGLWFHLSERHEHEHVHEPMEHEHRHVHDAHHQHPHDGDFTAPHTHWHRHSALRHKHPHYPDLHHRHSHG